MSNSFLQMLIYHYIPNSYSLSDVTPHPHGIHLATLDSIPMDLISFPTRVAFLLGCSIAQGTGVAPLSDPQRPASDLISNQIPPKHSNYGELPSPVFVVLPFPRAAPAPLLATSASLVCEPSLPTSAWTPRLRDTRPCLLIPSGLKNSTIQLIPAT